MKHPRRELYQCPSLLAPASPLKAPYESPNTVKSYLEQVDVVLLAQRGHQADVSRLVAVRGEDRQVRLLAVQRLGSLAQSAHNAVVDDGLLEDDLDRLNDI